MNDRNRIELLLPLAAILDVMENGVRVTGSEDQKKVVACIAKTRVEMDALMADVAQDDAVKLLRRVSRAHNMGLGRFKNEAARLDIYSYGLYYMLKVLTDRDVLVLGQDGYRDTVETFLAVLALQDLDEFSEARAKSQGRMMLQTYQALGYFARVPWPETL